MKDSVLESETLVKDKPVVSCKNLSKYWDDFCAVKQVSLDIPAGAIVALVGPNGAGKTTWMKMVSGLLESTEGSIEVCGVDVVKNPRDVHQLIGFLPDFFGLYENLTAYEYLRFYCLCYGLKGAAIDYRINELLERVSLTDKRDTILDNLSRGMKQRMAIARSLVSDPPLLILDEPSAGLDPEARSSLQDLFVSLAQSGKTLIVSSHILSELQQYSTHVAILQKGKLVAWGPTGDLAKSDEGQELLPVLIRVLDEKVDESVFSKLDARMIFQKRKGALLSYNFHGRAEEVPAVIQKIVSAGPPVLSIGLEDHNIQDVYLKFMKGSQND